MDKDAKVCREDDVTLGTVEDIADFVYLDMSFEVHLAAELGSAHRAAQLLPVVELPVTYHVAVATEVPFTHGAEVVVLRWLSCGGTFDLGGFCHQFDLLVFSGDDIRVCDCPFQYVDPSSRRTFILLFNLNRQTL